MYSPRVVARFFSYVSVGSDDHCWDWGGACGSAGYGNFWITEGGNGRVVGAHRVAWILKYGRDVPPGLCVLHRCDNRRCVNPAHLFIGTVQDNNADRHAKGRTRAPKGEAHRDAKLTVAQVREIRRLHSEGMSTRALARVFPVGKSSIHRITQGSGWIDV